MEAKMKDSRFLFAGILFGVVLTRSEVLSWFRIQEMFRFQSFQMYGIIGLAVVTGILSIQIIKKYQLKDVDGTEILIDNQKSPKIIQYLVGGFIFGLGWALTGACPGPLYALIGHGIWVVLVPLSTAIMGTFFYGILRDHLPH